MANKSKRKRSPAQQCEEVSVYEWKANIIFDGNSGPITGSWYLEDISELPDIMARLRWTSIIKIDIQSIPLPSLEVLRFA